MSEAATAHSPDPVDRARCRARDAADPLAPLRAQFAAPENGGIFLDANSIGAMPASVPERMAHFFSAAWVEKRRQGWNHFQWMERPAQIGDAIAPLIGARAGEVLACDNTTVNLFKMLAYAWKLRGSGDVILTENGNFPTDLYVAQGLPGLVDGARLRVCRSRDELLAAITPEVAVVYLSHVDYRSSERWDMADVNRRARAADALTVWDLSHAAGAVPVDLNGSGVDFAVGCGYKYLSMGPGGPAYLWVSPKHAQRADWPAICGWMGHRDVFAFATDYAPLPGAPGHATGTPTVIANEVAWCAAEILRQVDPPALWAKHRALSELMDALLEQRCGGYGVVLNSPRDYDRRGGHVSFSHPGAGAVCEALLAAGVVGSFRKPNAIRFGLGALYLSYEDVWEAVARLEDILRSERWREPKYRNVSV